MAYIGGQCDYCGALLARDDAGSLCCRHPTCVRYGASVHVPTTAPDPVDNPAHYTNGRKFQPADIIEDWGLSWAAGNCVKYLSRAGRKGDHAKHLEDLRKAVWMAQRELKRIEKKGK